MDQVRVVLQRGAHLGHQPGGLVGQLLVELREEGACDSAQGLLPRGGQPAEDALVVPRMPEVGEPPHGGQARLRLGRIQRKALGLSVLGLELRNVERLMGERRDGTAQHGEAEHHPLRLQGSRRTGGSEKKKEAGRHDGNPFGNDLKPDMETPVPTCGKG